MGERGTPLMARPFRLERVAVIRLWFPQTKYYLGYALRSLKLQDVQREGDFHLIVGLSHNLERKMRATEFG